MVRWALALVALVVLGIAGQCHSEVREWEVGPESLVRAPDNLEGESCPAAGGCVFFLTAGSGFVRTNASTTHFRANADTTAEWDAVTLEEDNRRLEGEFFNVISTGPSSYSIAAANPALNPRTVLLDVVGPWRTPSLATTADLRFGVACSSGSGFNAGTGFRIQLGPRVPRVLGLPSGQRCIAVEDARLYVASTSSNVAFNRARNAADNKLSFPVVDASTVPIAFAEHSDTLYVAFRRNDGVVVLGKCTGCSTPQSPLKDARWDELSTVLGNGTKMRVDSKGWEIQLFADGTGLVVSYLGSDDTWVVQSVTVDLSEAVQLTVANVDGGAMSTRAPLTLLLRKTSGILVLQALTVSGPPLPATPAPASEPASDPTRAPREPDEVLATSQIAIIGAGAGGGLLLVCASALFLQARRKYRNPKARMAVQVGLPVDAEVLPLEHVSILQDSDLNGRIEGFEAPVARPVSRQPAQEPADNDDVHDETPLAIMSVFNVGKIDPEEDL